MKIRAGFVSNSSSSSFVCNFCGREECGYNLTYEEAGMCECKNEHVFCEDELISYENDSWDLGDDYDNRFEIPEKFCPVCNRLKEMKKDEKYKQYKELYEHFNGINPDGCI